jgi:hypothetical protein
MNRGEGVLGRFNRYRNKTKKAEKIIFQPFLIIYAHHGVFIDKNSGAGNETRTRDPNLGKVMLYQLSYSR